LSLTNKRIRVVGAAFRLGFRLSLWAGVIQFNLRSAYRPSRLYWKRKPADL